MENATRAGATMPLRNDRWLKLLRSVHALRRQLDLSEEDYRDAIERATGRRNCRELGHVGLGRVLEELQKLRPLDRLPDLPGVGKLRALWICAWHLGVVQDRREAAMAAFLRREADLDAAGWAKARDIGTAIDRLKAWVRREADVTWPGFTERHDRARSEALAVLTAQHRMLELPAPSGLTNSTLEAINLRIAELGDQCRKVQSI